MIVSRTQKRTIVNMTMCLSRIFRTPETIIRHALASEDGVWMCVGFNDDGHHFAVRSLIPANLDLQSLQEHAWQIARAAQGLFSDTKARLSLYDVLHDRRPAFPPRRRKGDGECSDQRGESK